MTAAATTSGEEQATATVGDDSVGGSGRRRWWSNRPTWEVATAIGLLAMLVRAVGVDRANDVFIDELLYTHFAAQIADGVLPNEGGRPFLLHPPGSLLLDGLVVHLFNLSGSPVDLVLAVRWVNAVLGAVTVALVFVLVRRVVSQPLAMGAALLLTFDPFVLRNNGRVMIETPAVLWLVAGWAVLLTTASSASARVARRGELAAGLLLGFALVTKDMTAVPALGALFVALAWRRTLTPRTVMRVTLVALVPYAVYLAFMGHAGILSLWTDDKVSGGLRMLGVRQETGFNAVPVSLADRLIAQLSRFGTSYVLLGIAVPVAVLASFSRVPAQRFLGIVALCTGLMGSYAAVGGAAEEQFGYYVILTAVPALAVAVQMLLERQRVVHTAATEGRVPSLSKIVQQRRGFPSAVRLAGSAFLLATIALGIESRTVTDDGLIQAEHWLEELPPGTDVAVTGVTGEYASPHYDISPSLDTLLANDNQYVLTSSAPIEQGYGYASPKLLRWLEVNARPVFERWGPSNGKTVVWRIDRTALVSSVAAGVWIPPVAPPSG